MQLFKLFFAYRLPLTYPALCYKEIRVPPKKQRYFPLRHCPIQWTFKMLLRHVDRQNVLSTLFDKARRLARSTGDRWSNSVDSTCDGRRSTDDLGQFVTLSVHWGRPPIHRVQNTTCSSWSSVVDCDRCLSAVDTAARQEDDGEREGDRSPPWCLMLVHSTLTKLNWSSPAPVRLD